LTPALLVGAASAFIGFGEDPECHRYCRGVMVDRLVRQVLAKNTADAPWDAALVHHAGYWSHYSHRGNNSSWPIPARHCADANALVDFASRANILDRRPEVGDLFVLWSPARRRFVHTGIVLYVGSTGEFPSGHRFIECVVLSPNVQPDGRIGGPDTLRLTRRISPDRGDWFIRWAELDSTHKNGDAATARITPPAPAPDDNDRLREAA
jgi:hypothetical protein